LLRKSMAAVPFVFLLVVPSTGAAATVNLLCSYEESLDTDRRITSPAHGELSAQIKFSEKQVTDITVSKSSWCNPSAAFVTETEIGFACAFDLAGQRISYSFTFDRLKGTFEQRFFVGGKLGQVSYGQCEAQAASGSEHRSFSFGFRQFPSRSPRLSLPSCS
jgi:hypothetical protein